MERWLEQGMHGAMDYLERNKDKRYDPTVLVPGAKTMIVALLTYDHSGRDYHRAVKSALYKLKELLTLRFGEDIFSSTHQHIFCDSAPLLERRWAVEAGLGWIGRNHQLIHPQLGSMVHPGEMLIQVRVDDDLHRPVLQDSCGDCRACLDACPPKALRNDPWDATKCIAYTTHYCVACQVCCPYNKLRV